MSPSLNFKQTGSSSLFSLASSPFKHRRTSSYLFTLTSSPFNTGERAPTVHRDEPFTALQTGGLLPTIHIDELSLQHRRTSSYMFAGASPSLNFKQTGSSSLFSLASSPFKHRQTSSYLFTLTSSPFNTGRRAPTVHRDEPFTALQTGGLLPTIHIDELSLQHRRTSSYMFAGASTSLNFKQTGSSSLFSL